MDEVEAIERATLAAVPPQAQQDCQGWLVALDEGTVGRAHSAAPLRHGPLPVTSIAAVEALYAAAGLPAVFRLPDVAVFDELRAALRDRGYAGARPTEVQVARLQDVPEGGGEVEIAAAADAGWQQLFLGEGFDPVDGASRLGLLRRSRETVFASVRRGGATVAVGAACFSHGWCGVHGMRTAPASRRQGLAQQVLRALCGAARSRGLTQAFLQVQQDNAAARAAYGRQGFGVAWTYSYWKKP